MITKIKILLASFLTLTVLTVPAIALASTNNYVFAAEPAGPSGAQIKNRLRDNPIIKELNKIVKFLTAAVGIVVVGAIIIGGIQYSIAGDNAEVVTRAKKRITNSVIALAAFLFIWAFFRWLIP